MFYVDITLSWCYSQMEMENDFVWHLGVCTSIGTDNVLLSCGLFTNDITWSSQNAGNDCAMSQIF